MPTKTKSRSARPAPPKRQSKSEPAKPSRPTRRASTTNNKKRKAPESDEDEEENENAESSADEGASDGYKDSGASSAEDEALDSDRLDEDEDEDDVKPGNKRKAGKKASPRKRRRKDEDDEEQEWDGEDEDGREIVGRVVEAPKTGRVPPGQISKNTFNFLTNLKKPECNDRQWFKLNEPVYRLAEQEWKDFIIALTDDLVDVDPQVPPLPPKDVIHRIYRDVRFSNDKTPYKTGFSASFSRGGRKGLFAHYHVMIKPGNESMFAAGAWCPGKNELDTIRAHIKHNPARLRALLKDPDFIDMFGQPKPGKRSSIFGREDELKNAPKGVAKDHKDIDLLKCRTFAVVHKFKDETVLSPEFREELKRVMDVARPFVHCLNDWMTVGLDEEEGAEEADDDDE
ncbi:unnamed protein product [Peniophora sp. CBMAI 1063]|nr:unnamed protein product [Peniophora sp. CBMAI 1063]